MPEVEGSVEVAASEDQGNVPIDAPVTPSQPTEPAAPAAEEPVATTEAPAVEPELFELPDGRKVDGATLAQEYRNLLPEFTRKSQELARLTGGNPPVTQPTNQPADGNPLSDPNYVPTTYAELEEHIAKGIFSRIEQSQKAAAEAETALVNQVNEQLAEVKKGDPNVNESALFVHATKYHFTDLRLAYQNMKDMGLAVKKAVTTTSTNIQKRNDPVSIQPGAGSGAPNPSQFGSAVDYYRSLKK